MAQGYARGMSEAEFFQAWLEEILSGQALDILRTGVGGLADLRTVPDFQDLDRFEKEEAFNAVSV